MIKDGKWNYRNEAVINQYQLRMPMVDVTSIEREGALLLGLTGVVCALAHLAPPLIPDLLVMASVVLSPRLLILTYCLDIWILNGF